MPPASQIIQFMEGNLEDESSQSDILEQSLLIGLQQHINHIDDGEALAT